MKRSLLLLTTAALITGLGAPAASSAILVDYDDGLVNGIHDASIRNGGFEQVVVTGTTDTYAETPFWTNIGTGGSGQELVAINLTHTSPQNAIVAAGGTLRIIALNTGHTLSLGETVNFSYFWRDALNWVDATNQMRFSIYTTANNQIGGTIDQQVFDLSGISTVDATYQEHADSLAVTAAMAGKNLFIEIHSPDGAGFVRIDNVFVEVVPEPSSLALLGLGGLLIARRRRA